MIKLFLLKKLIYFYLFYKIKVKMEQHMCNNYEKSDTYDFNYYLSG